MNHGAASDPGSDPAERRREALHAAQAVFAAFGVYFCMYAFRKPFAVALYQESAYFGFAFKALLVTAQTVGYALSKAIGIKVVGEMPASRRIFTLAFLIAFAEAALLLFGAAPRPWNAAFFFLNGLALGMVFGLVLACLEGRRLTELLAAGLCASFILADGVVKSVGAWLLERGVPEDWMPAAAGGLFLLPFAAFTAILARVPPPATRDVAARNVRAPMSGAQRTAFLRRYGVGLIPILTMFMLVTVVRSIRADYASEIWIGLGATAAPSTFTQSEMLVALGVLAVNGAAVFIVDNRRAFLSSLVVSAVGFAIFAGAMRAQESGSIDGFSFMVLIGLGLYLPYVAVHTTVFERLLAMIPDRGNVGFLMYVADAIGYLGYAALMLGRPYLPGGSDVLGLLRLTGWTTIGVSAVCLATSWWFFSRSPSRPAADEPAP
jgi:hypothetical protein